MKHGDAAVLAGLGLVILLQAASVVMLVADADPAALPPATSSYHELPPATTETAALVSLIGPPDTTAPLAVPAEATITTGPMDRDADGYCPLDVAPLPARLDGTPTTEYALIELPKGTDQLVVEIQMLERSRQ